MKLIQTLTLSMVLGLSSLFATQYKVDAGHSTIGFKVRHMMVASVRGNFKEYEGHYNYNPQTKKIQNLEGIVKTTSVFTDDIKRDEHLRSKDFFDTKKYPDMRLKLIKHTGDKALVELTIKGITKQVEFDVDYLSAESKDPWGAVKTGFELHGKVSRKAYNMLFHKALETGGVAVRDEVKINLELEGIKVNP